MLKFSAERGRLYKLAKFIAQHRLLCLILILVITALFFFGAVRIRSEIILAHLFPYDHPYLKLHARFSEVFGSGGSGVVIIVNKKNGDIFNHPTLHKIKGITEEIELWDETYRALTVSIASNSVKVVKTLAKGEIRIEALMFPNVPTTEREIEELKKNIFSNPSYNGMLVSNDGTAAIIFTEMKENIPYEKMFGLLQNLVSKYSDKETSVHIVGFPMLMGWVYSLKTQIFAVFVISIILMILILFLIFRNFFSMAVPMINAFILSMWGLGFIGFTGLNLSPLVYVLAFFVGALIISSSVQVTCRYLEVLHSSANDKIRACQETIQTMLLPNFAAVTTDAAGFSVLILAKIILMQHLAIMMSFWMMSQIFTSILVPIICSLLPIKGASERWAKGLSQIDWGTRAITKLTDFSIGSGRHIVIGIIIGLMVFCSWQISRLKIGDPTPGSPLLWPEHPYNIDQVLMNEKFKASSENLVLYYEGNPQSVYDPIVLHTFEKFAAHMAKRLPDIYKTSSSIIEMGELLNLTQRDGDPIWYQLPRNEERLTGLIGYLRNTIGTASLQRFIDRNLERAQITLFFSDHTSDNMLRIRDVAYDFFNDQPFKTKDGEFKLAGGRIGMEIAVNEEMKRAHLVIDIAVLIAIFILCTLFFKSITGGLMLTLPLVFANSIAFSYMALANIGLSINTLPVAAIGVGVGVDFGIYLYSRCVEEFPLQMGDWKNTIIRAISTTGKAVVYTGLTIILPVIIWYFIAGLKFQAQMGFFLVMVMGINVILTLTLHPLLIYIIKPKFIKRGALTNRISIDAQVVTAKD